MATLKRWLIWTLHLFHDRELRKWLRDFYAQNCTHHPKTCFEFEIISLHKFCVTTCVFFKSISAKRWRWCAFLQFIFRLHSSFSDKQCCQLNLKLIWGKLNNCKSLELVFKVSRNFSTRLTQTESFEIDSTHSTFDSKMTLYKNHIFVNFIFDPLLANIFKIHNEKLKIVKTTLKHKNDNFWV